MNILKSKRFYILWLLSILGAISVIPYISSINKEIIITPKLVIGGIIQAALLYSFVVFFGLKLINTDPVKKINFKLVASNKFFISSIISGLCIGLIIKLLDKFLFAFKSNLLLYQINKVESWKSLLASFYGAINEEILLRLFAVSLFVFLFQRFTNLKKLYSVVISIVICAILFSCGHLPMMFKIVKFPNIWDYLRIFTLNGLAGIIFGLLYWRYGLMSCILSHFIADLLIHIF